MKKGRKLRHFVPSVYRISYQQCTLYPTAWVSHPVDPSRASVRLLTVLLNGAVNVHCGMSSAELAECQSSSHVSWQFRVIDSS